jgi:molybdenum cofactor synthesis domain-containing protein
MEMHAFGRLLPMESAQRRLLAAAHPIDRLDEVPLTEAFGRVAARTVFAPAHVPSFDRATWDGYAVRSADTRSATAETPVRLRVVGEVFAEGEFPRPLRTGESVAIATGGALPRGADAIAIFENVRRAGPWVEVSQPVRPRDRIAPPGDDFRKGTLLVRRGEELAPAELGALAACGLPAVSCYARPVVAIVPNGNELLLPGARPRRGSIFESNNVTLAAIVAAGGGIPRPAPPVPDDPDQIERALRAALKTSDLVLATGGSSVGERDHLPRVFPRLGRLLFHGVAVRPGKPTLAAAAGRKLVLGLPGHPSSCLANSFWLLLPILRKIARRPGPGWVDKDVTLGEGVLAPSPGLATVIPLALRDGRAYSTYHGSAAITSMSGARGFAVLPPGRRSVNAGERVRVHWLLPPLGPEGGPAAGNG